MNPNITCPSPPTESLYNNGQFPNFPMETIHIDIPYTDLGFNISVPNIGAIPNWIFHIIEYELGYFGAYFQFLIEYIGDWTVNHIVVVIGLFLGILNSVLGTIRNLTAPLGIFGIPIEILAISLLFVALVYLIIAIIKGLSKLTEVL